MIFFSAVIFGVIVKNVVSACPSAEKCQPAELCFTILLKTNKENLKWNSKYTNKLDPDFLLLSRKVQTLLVVSFRNTTGIDNIAIEKFRAGSVYADFIISLINNSSTTQNNLTAILSKANCSLELSSYQTPKTFKADLTIVSHEWKEAYDDPSRKEYVTLAKSTRTVLANVYKTVTGLLYVEILGFKESKDGKVIVEFRILLSSSSIKNAKYLEQTTIDATESSSTRTFQFGHIRIIEEKASTSNDGDEGKPAWVRVLVALSCIVIFILVIAFLYRVIGVSCAQPKFKLGTNDAAGERSGDERRVSQIPPIPPRTPDPTMPNDVHYSVID